MNLYNDQDELADLTKGFTMCYDQEGRLIEFSQNNRRLYIKRLGTKDNKYLFPCLTDERCAADLALLFADLLGMLVKIERLPRKIAYHFYERKT